MTRPWRLQARGLPWSSIWRRRDGASFLLVSMRRESRMSRRIRDNKLLFVLPHNYLFTKLTSLPKSTPSLTTLCRERLTYRYREFPQIDSLRGDVALSTRTMKLRPHNNFLIPSCYWKVSQKLTNEEEVRIESSRRVLLSSSRHNAG